MNEFVLRNYVSLRAAKYCRKVPLLSVSGVYRIQWETVEEVPSFFKIMQSYDFLSNICEV